MEINNDAVTGNVGTIAHKTSLAVSLDDTQVSDLFFNIYHRDNERDTITEDARAFAMLVGKNGNHAYIDSLVEDFFTRL